MYILAVMVWIYKKTGMSPPTARKNVRMNNVNGLHHLVDWSRFQLQYSTYSTYIHFTHRTSRPPVLALIQLLKLSPDVNIYSTV
jgi:hypothetical protein